MRLVCQYESPPFGRRALLSTTRRYQLICGPIHLIILTAILEGRGYTMKSWRVLALLCALSVMVGCISREDRIQGKQFAETNTNLASRVITKENQRKCLAHFKEDINNKYKETWRFRRLIPFETLTKNVAQSQLAKGNADIASKIVTFYSKVYGKGLLGLPIQNHVICYYKINNSKLTFLTSCHEHKPCPYVFHLPFYAYL